jgi:hypothetical protein
MAGKRHDWKFAPNGDICRTCGASANGLNNFELDCPGGSEVSSEKARNTELTRAYKKLNEAQELVVEAFNEWTPTQGPTDEWVRKAKAIKKSREY